MAGDSIPIRRFVHKLVIAPSLESSIFKTQCLNIVNTFMFVHFFSCDSYLILLNLYDFSVRDVDGCIVGCVDTRGSLNAMYVDV